MATTTEAAPELLTVNMGPQHPSTHGVLRLELVLDGERVVHCRPVIGYLHTGIEKTFEAKSYIQGVVLTDRMDYLNPLGNNLAYALSLEKLVACDIPPRASVLRVLLAELTRLASHLMFVGSIALDLGASSPFLYCWREREKILDAFEGMSGARMMTSFIRPGGLARDVPANVLDDLSTLIDSMPGYIDSYEELLTANPIFKERTEGVGRLSAEDALALGVTGPSLRGSGVELDLRRANPYCGYDTYQFGVPIGTTGDCYDRYLVRVAEMRESVKICRQALDRLPAGPVQTSDRKVMPPPREELAKSMEAVIHHFKLWTEGIRPPVGEAYVGVESPRGELGFYIVSDGSGRPVRVHERGPSFANLQALPTIIEGGSVADTVACIASLDPIMGEVDPVSLSEATRDRICKLAETYPERRTALLPALKLAQAEVGHLPSPVVAETADLVGVPHAAAYELVEFYTMLHREAEGATRVVVCCQLPCALRGANRLLQDLAVGLGIQPGETTPDGAVTLERTSECFGACHRAPMARVNDEYREGLTPEATQQLLSELRNEKGRFAA